MQSCDSVAWRAASVAPSRWRSKTEVMGRGGVNTRRPGPRGARRGNGPVETRAGEGASHGPPNEFAWRVHEGVNEWTARVDAKASIALAIEAAVAALVALLATGDGELAHASGSTAWLLGAGAVLLVISVGFALLVVYPQLRGRSTRREFQHDVVYFGHLRLWDAERLTERLAEGSGELPSLARQLVRMSKIAWRKHVWLQWSLALFVAGVLSVGGALVSERLADSSGAIDSAPSASTPAGTDR